MPDKFIVTWRDLSDYKPASQGCCPQIEIKSMQQRSTPNMTTIPVPRIHPHTPDSYRESSLQLIGASTSRQPTRTPFGLDASEAPVPGNKH